MLKAANITKGPRETHKSYVLRKCRAAVKQGATLCSIPGPMGYDDIYADTGSSALILLACVDRGHGRQICNRIQYGWKHS